MNNSDRDRLTQYLMRDRDNLLIENKSLKIN